MSQRIVAHFLFLLKSDCVTIVKTPHIRHFVIPGVTRNPALFEPFTILDAGSSPACQEEDKYFIELQLTLHKGDVDFFKHCLLIQKSIVLFSV
jgi:hypothetical protein